MKKLHSYLRENDALNLLLDTYVALWAITDHPGLSSSARTLIESPKASVWVSVVSLWEIAIKHALNRGRMPVSSQDAALYFRESGYQLLSIETEHVIAVEELPSCHRDPFDRMLVAQALIEPMRLLTHDAVIARYSDTIIRI